MGGGACERARRYSQCNFLMNLRQAHRRCFDSIRHLAQLRGFAATRCWQRPSCDDTSEGHVASTWCVLSARCRYLHSLNPSLQQEELLVFRLGESSGSPCSTSMTGLGTILYPLSCGERYDTRTIFPESIDFLLCRLLPDWVPIHPHRWWIHVRNVYIPMSYLYGIKYKHPENALILSLRQVGVTYFLIIDLRTNSL